MTLSFFKSIAARARAAGRGVRRAAGRIARVAWHARLLLVLAAGAALVTVGVARVFEPAGWIVAGSLLIAGALPDRPKGDDR